MKHKSIFKRCWKCKHIFPIRKKKKKHQCSACGTRETNRKPFQKWTIKDFVIIINDLDMKKETQKYQTLDDIPPYIIRIYLTQSKLYKHPKIAISWLVKKGYTPQDASTIINLLQEIFHPYQSPIKPPGPEPIEEPPEEPEPLYRYCMWIIRGCIHPEKRLSKDGTKCIKYKLEDDCLLLPNKESQ